MNIPVVLGILAVFGLLRFRGPICSCGRSPGGSGPTSSSDLDSPRRFPSSVISIYMGIVSIALLAFVSSSEERRDEVSRPLLRLMTEKRFAPLLGAVVVAIPALAAANVYVQMNVPIEPPFFPRTVHPASPPEITVHDKKIAIETGDSPFRQLETSNPEEFRKHVENGRRVYYQNCVFCHGDNMGGNGMFVHGLDPIPTNFADGDTIANLRETFLFWRAAKGGPGTAGRGRPLGFGDAGVGKDSDGRRDLGRRPLLYDFTGERPRALESPPVISRHRCRGAAVVLFAALWACADGPDGDPLRAQGPDVGTEAQRESGKVLYLKYCSQCHGEKGDGEGYATPHLFPRPRDFTSGRFKVRTTPNGALPTHQDLVNIIRRGMPYTSMPAWPNLSDQEVSDLAYFLTTFSPDFANPERAAQPMELPSAPASHGGVHRAREEALRGDRLPEVPRQPRPGRRTVGADADRRLRAPDTRGRPHAPLDLPGRADPRGHLPDDDARG